MEAPPLPQSLLQPPQTTTTTTVDVDQSYHRRSERKRSMSSTDGSRSEDNIIVVESSSSLFTDRDGRPDDCDVYRLYHPSEIRPTTTTTSTTTTSGVSGDDKVANNTGTLRLAEDTRFFYAHLRAGGRLSLHRTPEPLLSYRHRSGMSQSSNTPRRLLLQLRARAWEDAVFRGASAPSSAIGVVDDDDGRHGGRWSGGFAVWGGELTPTALSEDGEELSTACIS